jgi:hypothetical protein
MTVATAPAQVEGIDLNVIDPLEVAQEIVNIRQTIAEQQARLEKGMAILQELYSSGLVPKAFDASGMTFQLIAGRTSYDWSSVPAVKEAEAAVKVLKDQAKEVGTVLSVTGDPSWRISVAKAV